MHVQRGNMDHVGPFPRDPPAKRLQGRMGDGGQPVGQAKGFRHPPRLAVEREKIADRPRRTQDKEQ